MNQQDKLTQSQKAAAFDILALIFNGDLYSVAMKLAQEAVSNNNCLDAIKG